VDLCIERDIPIPGLTDDKQGDADAGKKLLGGIMAKLFGERNEIQVEEFTIQREEAQGTTEQGNAQTLKKYRFAKATPTPSVPSSTDQTGTPPKPQ